MLTQENVRANVGLDARTPAEISLQQSYNHALAEQILERAQEQDNAKSAEVVQHQSDRHHYLFAKQQEIITYSRLHASDHRFAVSSYGMLDLWV